MEIRYNIQVLLMLIRRCCCMLFFIMIQLPDAHAQIPVKKYTISKGEMQIVLSKNLNESDLDGFIRQYDLSQLALKKFINSDFQDSIRSNGWRIIINNKEICILSKPLFAVDNLNDPAERIKLTTPGNSAAITLNPVPMNTQAFGYNNFKNKYAFAIKDSVVTFFLRNNRKYVTVKLAGNFTGWADNALAMQQTDSGWIAFVKLKPGKYLYKFIADGNWLLDPDNKNSENDGKGTTNSVYYFTNSLFRLNGFINAKKVFIAGSFNNWDDNELRMVNTGTGWELPVFFTGGTYTYRYVVDRKWMTDPDNQAVSPNEFGEFNSVLRIGKSYLFVLRGYENAQKAFLSGSFNQWRNFELPMIKNENGWQLNYTLGAGNYEYKFYVDGKWVAANGKPVSENTAGSVFVIEPNYTFRLKGYAAANNIFISGDFNKWSPNAFAMKKDGDEWVIQIHLEAGKHLYKYIVDGKWIIDPGNELWEQNEFNTGNSVLWIEQ